MDSDRHAHLALWQICARVIDQGSRLSAVRLAGIHDGKKGKKQIVVGLLCYEQGKPVSIEVFKGNTSDVKTMPRQIEKVERRSKNYQRYA